MNMKYVSILIIIIITMKYVWILIIIIIDLPIYLFIFYYYVKIGLYNFYFKNDYLIISFLITNLDEGKSHAVCQAAISWS